MSEGVYFFDTYAFFEIIRGNPSYARFKGCRVITTIFNLAELNYGLKKEIGDAAADKITKQYRTFLVEVAVEDVLGAMTFRRQHKDCSIPDAVGYIISKRFKVPFLTGDGDFKGMPGVEFVR